MDNGEHCVGGQAIEGVSLEGKKGIGCLDVRQGRSLVLSKVMNIGPMAKSREAMREVFVEEDYIKVEGPEA